MVTTVELPYLSHEMGNLLTLLSGTYYMLGSRHPELIQDTGFQSMGADLDSMRELVNAMKENTIEGKNCNAVTVCHEVAESFLPICQKKGVRLMVKPFSESDDFRCALSYLRMKLVLVNLCKNAVEACENGNTIIISGEVDTMDRIRIHVVDDGVPIPPQMLPFLFQSHVTTKVTGSGYGLFLALEQVTEYGGSIHVDIAGKQKDFVITLPRRSYCRKSG